MRKEGKVMEKSKGKKGMEKKEEGGTKERGENI